MIVMEVANKWRGLCLFALPEKKKYVYGELIKRGKYPAIVDKNGWHVVVPETLCKLAGYDEEGNEVYRSCKR